MKRVFFIMFMTLCVLSSCVDVSHNPYSLHNLQVKLVYPLGYEDFVREGVSVEVEDVNQGNSYALACDSDGEVSFDLPDGVYRVSASDVNGDDVFNGSLDKVMLFDDATVPDTLVHSTAGRIIIKEIYCGGCMKYPEQGDYQSDQYIILHNNYPEVQYLDGLCFGTLCPYNSNGTNSLKDEEGNLPSYVPVIQAVWQFPGDGGTFPLRSGEDAVLCLRGAIDHSARYPLSVNLNKPGYFVCYNATAYTNTTYHPAPGNNISVDRYMDLVVKVGKANAYTFSINSPAAVLFRSPEGMTMAEYVAQDGAIGIIPGNSSDKVVCIDPSLVVDAVEVFNGSSSSNRKRLLSSLDAGYVSLSGTFLGHTLFRKTDEDMSQTMGYEYLQDTNNSSQDFYERETQSLHK